MNKQDIHCYQCRWFRYDAPNSQHFNKIVGRCENKDVMQGKIIMVYCEDLLVTEEFGCIFAED